MQSEPIHFGAVSASRAKRSGAGFAHVIRNTHKPANTESILDEAFADFTRADAESPLSAAANKTVSINRPSMTQALIADIATQLEALDSQRRQLARLLESVDTNMTV
jgi:hypothetical protein